MKTFELRLSFERIKNNTLNKIQNTKEKWQRTWLEAQGNPAAEAALVHLRLEMQIMEVQALEELRELDEKIKKLQDENPLEEDMA